MERSGGRAQGASLLSLPLLRVSAFQTSFPTSSRKLHHPALSVIVVPVVPRVEVRLATLGKLPPHTLSSPLCFGVPLRDLVHGIPLISRIPLGALLMHPNTQGSMPDMKAAAHCVGGGRF
ncbi:hypothetical protein E2C01_050059 [Portunus trituberculatus]|uniref:Uncharacterized protein n=1 Tax=Portunus trituberculatus TaxID=210409 RepID=A0A5B7GFN8_PORTR|nr:hypothetical protein [Portunus trituberculatus]